MLDVQRDCRARDSKRDVIARLQAEPPSHASAWRRFWPRRTSSPQLHAPERRGGRTVQNRTVSSRSTI